MTGMLECSDEQSPLLDAINELRIREDLLSEERSLSRLRDTQVAPGSVHEIVDLRRGKIASGVEVSKHKLIRFRQIHNLRTNTEYNRSTSPRYTLTIFVKRPSGGIHHRLRIRR